MRRKNRGKPVPMKTIIPNMITSGNMLCGMLSLVLAFHGHLVPASWLIFIAVIFDFMDGKSKGALMWWWSQSKKLSTLRENVLRLAAYRYFTDQLKTRTDVYGASRKAEIDAIVDRDDRAVKLARELIGDYGNISHAGQYLRERIIPFYSWLEINAPRYVRLFRNLKHEGGSMTGMAGTMAWKAAKLGLKACTLMALVALWNGAMFPDEEEELQETGREQLHLILGRRADGSIITLRFQGALSDALSWFGMDNPFETAKRISKGRMSGKDVGKEVVTAAPKKVFQGLRPEPKLLYEVVSGQSFYPDPTRPRPIRDTGEHIARVFSLDRVYNRLAGKPMKGGDWPEQLKADIQGLLLAESDPGEQAYYTARKYVFDWLDKNGVSGRDKLSQKWSSGSEPLWEVELLREKGMVDFYLSVSEVAH